MMKRTLNILLIGLALLLISGCTNNDLDTFNEEKKLLTNDILELKKLVYEKDDEISRLEKLNSNNRIELRELEESLKMVRASAYLRLDDYTHTFHNLQNIYKINSKHLIKDDWYVISGDYFQIELLDYKDAVKVEFYTLRMESDQGPMLAFTDTDPIDGWIYINDDISQIINKHTQSLGGFSYEPYFSIYTEVTFKDGKVIKTSKLPIYNKYNNKYYPKIQVKTKKIECDYIEPIYGEIKTFSLSLEDGMLEDVLNYWIKEIAKMGISYGNTSSGENILDELLVVDAYIEGVDIVIVMNDAFIAFESSDSNNYTNAGNFVFGLQDIVSQVTDAENMTINYYNKKSGVINPEGYLIDNIPLRN